MRRRVILWVNRRMTVTNWLQCLNADSYRDDSTFNKQVTCCFVTVFRLAVSTPFFVVDHGDAAKSLNISICYYVLTVRRCIQTL